MAPELRPSTNRTSIFSTNYINTWNIEPQLTFKKLTRLGNIEAMVGSTFYEKNSSLIQLTGSGFNSDVEMKNIRSASSIIVSQNVKSKYRYNALFGRLNYNWDDKYIINLTTRRDGSSRFGPDNQVHNFWSAALAWVFTNEKFVEKGISFLSFGKLRLSYGTTGNDQIGDYQFLSLYNQPFNISVPYQNSVSITPFGHSNPIYNGRKQKNFNLV